MERHQRKALRALPAEKAHPHADRRLFAHGGQRLHRAGVRHHAQKYLLGVTDEQYDAIVAEKFKTYVGSLLTATASPGDRRESTFGQLAQGGLTPHVEKMRMTAAQFAAATGLTVMDVGIVSDANPTSSDAILAQSQTLVLLAQQLNTGNGDALRTPSSHMAQAIARSVTLEELTRRAGRDGAFQVSGYALGGGDGGRGHQDRLRPAGVRRHGHVLKWSALTRRTSAASAPGAPGAGPAGAAEVEEARMRLTAGVE